MPELLGPDVADQVRGPVGMSVDVTVEAGHANHPVGTIGPPVLRRVELLLGKLRHEKAQAFDLLRVQDAVEDLVVVLQRDDPPLRDVPQVRPRREEDRRGLVGKDLLGEVEIHVETHETRKNVDCHLGEEHSPFGMVRKGKRRIGKEPLLLDLLGSHLCKLLPGGAGKAGGRPDRDRLATGHPRVPGQDVQVIP